MEPASSSDAASSASGGRSYLSKQDLATLNAAELHPLHPLVISRQATINIGAQSPFLPARELCRAQRSRRARAAPGMPPRSTVLGSRLIVSESVPRQTPYMACGHGACVCVCVIFP